MREHDHSHDWKDLDATSDTGSDASGSGDGLTSFAADSISTPSFVVHQDVAGSFSANDNSLSQDWIGAHPDGPVGPPSGTPTTELWITAFQGSDENLLIHGDDTGNGVASNIGAVYTPDSGNQPAYNSEARLFAYDTQDNTYVVVTSNAGADPTKILVGSLSSVLANPAATPTLTTVFTDTSNTGGSGFVIDGLTLDPDNSEIYFVDHQSLEKVGYNGSGLTVLGSVTTQTDPGTGDHLFMDGLALDLPRSVAYFTSETTSSTSTIHGPPQTIIGSNLIYKSSTLPNSSGANSVTFSKLVDVPFVDGVVANGTGVQGITVDTANGLIYFTTQAANYSTDGVHFQQSNSGVYAYNPTGSTVAGIAAGAFKTIWQQGLGGGPVGPLESIHIDDATGK